VLYVPRLCPTLLLEGDSAEIVTAAALWGVPHAPGFPLYTAAAHVVTRLPLGELPWRVHLTSAVLHAATVFCVARLGARLAGSILIGVVAAAALAVSRAFFLGSLYAEVFPLNDLFFAALLMLAVEAARAETDAAMRRLVVGGGGLLGLACAHHPLVLFGVPAVGLLAWQALVRCARGSPRVLATAAFAAVLGFCASYALVPMAASRDPALSFGDVHDLSSLIRVVLRLDYGGPLNAALHEPEKTDIAKRLWHWSASLGRSMSLLPVVAAAGLALHSRQRRSRREAIAIALGIVLPGPVFAALNAHFQADDEGHLAIAERFTTMAMIPLALGVALAFAATSSVIRRGTALALLLLVPGARGVDLSGRREGLVYAHDLLRPAPDGAVVLVAGDLAAPAAAYVCEVEHACGDRIVLVPGLFSMPWYRARERRRHPSLELPRSVHEVHRLVDAEIDRRPVLTMPSIVAKDGSLETYDVTPALLLFRVTRRGVDTRTEALRWGEELAESEGLRHDALVHPSMTSTLTTEYAIAMKNHAVVARELGAEELAHRLDARSHGIAE
jgi:hypothetical protein